MDLLHGVGEFFGLDIGTNAIRVVQLSGNSQQGWSLQRFGYMPIDSKILQDASEVGRKRLGEAVMQAIAQAGIKTKNIALGMPSAKTYTAIIEVANMPLKDLEKSIKYELDQYIPMPIDEAKADYLILGPSPIDAEKIEVLISSTANNYAEERMEDFESLGLNVIAQEPEQIAMARALTPIGVNDPRMIIDLGERSTDLVVMYQGAPRLVRSIQGGLSLIVRTVASNLGVKEEQARQFIIKFGLAQDKLDGQVFKALDSTLENFASELLKSARFFQNKYNNLPLGGIVLSGFAGGIPFIAEYIEAKTNISTIRGNPWQMVRVTPQQQQILGPVANEFAVVVGLAERSND